MKTLLSAIFCISFIFSTSSYAQDIPKTSKEEVIAAFEKNVKKTPISQSDDAKFKEEITENHPELKLDRTQFFLAVDKNPKKQNIALVFWDQENKNYEVYGYSKVSTGSVRKGHFYTPSGWFEQIPENGSYRALGTKNENGIRGIGLKGARVWDFGWQKSYSGFKRGLNIDIRFEMHDTDPTYLEQRLGRPDSDGCVRLPDSFNTFLDVYGIMDKNLEDINYWVLRKDRKPAADAGSWILVFDSSKSHDEDNNIEPPRK